MSALPAIIHGDLDMCVPSHVCPELSPQTEKQCSVMSNYTITSPDCRAFWYLQDHFAPLCWPGCILTLETGAVCHWSPSVPAHST